MSLCQLIYRSTAARFFGDKELERLVSQARIFNYSQAITGVLFYADQQFLQVLEGDQADIKKLYGTICQDDRHTAVTTVFNELVRCRIFPHWSLGYSTVGAAALKQLTSYLSPENREALLPSGYEAKEVINDLLLEFVDHQIESLTHQPSD